MSPDIYRARKKLTYPIYGADFDPLNQDFLLVGGGGGSSSTGVPNKISLIDVSKRDLSEVVDIELAKNEDSVVSLVVAHSDSTSLLAYAGINSSADAQRNGTNEHFRSFRIGLPARTRRDENTKNTIPSTSPVASTEAITRSALFRSATGPPSDCYQRVLRLSPPIIETDKSGTTVDEKSNEDGGKRLRKRIVAIASGLAPQNELLSLAAIPAPTTGDVISRVNLEKIEASDLDIMDTPNAKQPFVLSYCTDTQVFLQKLPSIKGGPVTEPIQVHETTAAKDTQSKPKIRALRFLSSRYMILLLNRAGRTGVDLLVLKTDTNYTQARHILLKRIKNMKQAVGLDVCRLSSLPNGTQQFVIAVAGQDSTIQILTIDWSPGQGMGKFKQYETLENVHNGPITKITFSNFISPELPVSSKTRSQYIRLASVGVDQTVVVHTLPLRPTPTQYTKEPRYVLTPPPDYLQTAFSVFMAMLTIGLCALFMQVFMEVRGAVPPILNATSWMPQSWQNRIGTPYLFSHNSMPGPIIPESMPPMVESAIDRLKLADATAAIENLQAMEMPLPSIGEIKDTLLNLVSEHESNPESEGKAIVIRDVDSTGGELTTEVQHEAEVVKQETLKKWGDLSEKAKKGWKQKLVDAGHWTEQQGESVLKGIFFSELGGFVAELARG